MTPSKHAIQARKLHRQIVKACDLIPLRDEAICKAVEGGYGIRTLARELNLAPSTIQRIAQRNGSK